MTIYGPKGIKRFVETSLQVSQTHLTYPLAFVEIDPVGGVVLKTIK
ncbi:Ribonuclease Z [Weissella viridescens]|uniref:Ribonuclease Z n=1 Tax=Weissella viridescens TaxID=1629 RepID=A0A380P2A0_WEIVI|nr:Ribonuclease Z [Weissella viridescens]